MARISGVNLPRNKRIEIGLTYVFGIGRTSAKQIVSDANIAPSTRCGDLTDQEVTTIRALIDDNYQTEGDLRRQYSQNIKRLSEIGSAAGRRHRVGLPVRGQRTRTNARTRKGKVKIAVAKKS
jgi:small subunit ribosomal protein S13|tara:strand:+ start:12100 stop:12468 length:369 start_codon:yes stop_codon:yes gene_type:complete